MTEQQDEFLTTSERAAIVALEAMRRGLWAAETGLAFVAYVGEDLQRVAHWETMMHNVVDAEEECHAVERKVEELQEQADAAQGEYRDACNKFMNVLGTGAITTGRTAKFGG